LACFKFIILHVKTKKSGEIFQLCFQWKKVWKIMDILHQIFTQKLKMIKWRKRKKWWDGWTDGRLKERNEVRARTFTGLAYPEHRQDLMVGGETNNKCSDSWCYSHGNPNRKLLVLKSFQRNRRVSALSNLYKLIPQMISRQYLRWIPTVEP
jgi:hypothetical protein